MSDEHKRDDFVSDIESGEYPEAAMLDEPGKFVHGYVTGFSEGHSSYGPYPIVLLDTDEGERSIHCFHLALQNKLFDADPAVGDRLGIHRRENRTSRSGNEYADYYVRVQKDTEGPARLSDVISRDDDTPPSEDEPGQSSDSGNIPF